MNRHTSVTTIAEALRALADELEKTPVADFAPIWLQVNFQVGKTSGAVLGDRCGTVDAVASVLDLGAPDGSDGNIYAAGREKPYGVAPDVYCSMTPDEANPYVR